MCLWGFFPSQIAAKKCAAFWVKIHVLKIFHLLCPFNIYIPQLGICEIAIMHQFATKISCHFIKVYKFLI